jgi:hypothetical protein
MRGQVSSQPIQVLGSRAYHEWAELCSSAGRQQKFTPLALQLISFESPHIALSEGKVESWQIGALEHLRLCRLSEALVVM